MKAIFINRLMLILVVLAVSSSSCKKDFLDVNENPNAPANVDLTFVLPSAQANLAYTLGNQLAVAGGLWAQYWTQGPNANQYNETDRYFYDNTEADRPWRALYAGSLRDLEALQEKASEEGKRDYMAVAKILQAYTLQVITDAWGDVPFSEALQGFEGNTSPKYDSQESLYDAMITLTDGGLALLDSIFASGEFSVTPDGIFAGMGHDDLVYQGDIDKWYRFGMTLKLKIYLRQVNVRPGVASAGISAMIADPTYYLESGYDAYVHYIDEKFRQNPLYTTVQALNPAKNIFASKTSVDYLNSLTDPRVFDYYEPVGAGVVVGILQGAARNPDLFPPPVDDNNFSQYSEQIIGASAPVRLMSAAESMFLQAEAMARGFMSGDAQGTYEAAVEDSWSQWEFASTEIGNISTYLAQDGVVYPSGGSLDEQLRVILIQKWVAMNGNQNFEAWTEFRRTGYPDFLIESNTSVYGNNNSPKIFPTRLLYSSDELTTNSNVINGLTLTDKVWWDVN